MVFVAVRNGFETVNGIFNLFEKANFQEITFTFFPKQRGSSEQKIIYEIQWTPGAKSLLKNR